MAFLSKIFGSQNDRDIKALSPIVTRINELEKDFVGLSSEALLAKTTEFKNRLAKGETVEMLLPEAFAAVREAAKRTLGQRHFDVQLMGGIIMHNCGIAEMRTGEGKTLVATLPVYLNALAGLGVHVVTVNDYLARRDAAWMGQIYSALGLTVGAIAHDSSFAYDSNFKILEASQDADASRDQTGSFHVAHEFLRPIARKDAYLSDITYGTNSEFGFDYLRDNLVYSASNLRQRSPYFAIVDEIDSILIDEARTPLIISAPTTESESLYKTFAKVAANLKKDEHYTVEEKHKSILLTDAGITAAEKMLGVGNIYTDKGVKYVHHLETAVRAKALFTKDKEYVVKDGEVVIVDSFTGRLQPGRRWSEGLHQAIEAKENVKIADESRTFASITYQNFFRLYKKLGGMTGTALTSAEEFLKVYRLRVVSIPTNTTIQRKDKHDLIFQTEKGKWKAVARKVKELNDKGQPVLIGTVSIERNELLSTYLRTEGVKHEVLNAKNHEREGEIIAQAGRWKAVTIATNMAGRGVDVKLGGNPTTDEDSKSVREAGGLFVLGTERHEARRIDNQLRGRSGRQGDPGETQFFVSLEDDLMRVFASDMIKKMMGRFGIPEDEPIENGIITKALETAQARIEGFNFDARKHVLEFDDVMNFHRKTVYERRRRVLTGSIDDVLAELEIALQKIAPEERAKAESARKTLGDEKFGEETRRVFLQAVDMFWVEHLEAMDYLRGSVNLRAYGQRDPLVEYKREGTILFRTLMDSVDVQVSSVLARLGSVPESALRDMANVALQAQNISMAGGGDNSADKHGRNDKIIVVKNGEEKEVKWKKLDEYTKDGWTVKQ